MAMTAKNMPYKDGFGPFASDVYRAPLSYPFRDSGVDGAAAAARAIDQIDKQVGAANLAAIVIEPIQGEGGFIVPADGFLRGLAEWCTANNVVFVADEVQTGFARTGAMFAVEHDDVVPDLIVTAKGIAGGLPLSAVTGRAEIMDAAHVGGLGGTYGGNPVACAAALGAIRTMEEQDLRGRARDIEALFLPRLEALRSKYDVVADIRGRGAMLAIELTAGAGDLTPNPAATGAINKHCHSQGLVTLTCGTYGNVLRFLPPLVAPDHLLHEAMDVLAEVASI
jgi:4-aminobutyrate aminotransferase/(S)-3-amino-2-methylpropionate transaminase